MKTIPDPIVLIDAKNFLYRHHATHSKLSTQSGFPTGVLYGCGIALLSLARKFPGAPLVLVWDGEGETWRHLLLHPFQAEVRKQKAEEKIEAGKDKLVPTLPEFMQTSLAYLESIGPKTDKPVQVHQTRVAKEKPVGYKAHREPTMNAFADAAKQLPIFRTYCSRIGLRQFQFDTLEGDDLLGILATLIVERDLFQTVIIHSSDRDFYQFIGNRIRIYRNDKGGYFPLKEDIRKEFGVDPDDWNKLRAILGDASDNIPHLFRGVGPKTAAVWVNQGLDASQEDWKDLPVQVRSMFLEEKLRKYNVRERWEELHANYLCSRIVTDWKDKVLAPSLRKELSVFENLTRNDLLHDKSKRTDKNWRWLTEYLVKYEMAELYSRRQEIWRLP